MRPHTTATRDSALRRLAMSNRWLIAGSVALTGVLSEVAASAFPGKTLKTSAAAKVSKGTATAGKSDGSAGKSHSHSGLKAPAQAPQATTEQHTTPEQHSEAAPEQHSEAAPEQHSEETTPEQHSEDAPERHAEVAPEQHAEATPSAPVVSGGS